MGNSPTLFFLSLSLTIISFSGNALAGQRFIAHAPPDKPIPYSPIPRGPHRSPAWHTPPEGDPSYVPGIISDAYYLGIPPLKLIALRKTMKEKIGVDELIVIGKTIRAAVGINRWVFASTPFPYYIKDPKKVRLLRALFDDELTFKWMKWLRTSPNARKKDKDLILLLPLVRAAYGKVFLVTELNGPNTSLFIGGNPRSKIGAEVYKIESASFPKKVYEWLDAQIDYEEPQKNNLQNLIRF